MQLGWASSPCTRHWGKHGFSGIIPFLRWNLTERAALRAGWGNSGAAAAGAHRTGEACQGTELGTAAKPSAGSPGAVCAEHREGWSDSCDLLHAHHGAPEPSCALGTSRLAQLGALLAGKGTWLSRCAPSSGRDEERAVCA